MNPDQSLDREPIASLAMEHERELLKKDAETLRTFYSLTGPARKDYTEQMADAEAYRIQKIREAQAEGLRKLRQAEADGYKAIGEALASLPNASQVVEIAKLHALQRIADALAEGKATKMVIPHDLGNIFSILDGFGRPSGTTSNLTGESKADLKPMQE